MMEPQSPWASGLYLNSEIAKSVATVALPVLALFCCVGTGGASTPEFFRARGEIGYPTPFVSLRFVEHVGHLTAAKNLEFLADVLLLNQSELARALSVSRQTIYNWQDGEPISEQNAAKLQRLASAAERFVGCDRRKTKELVRRKIAGRTILDIVATGQPIDLFVQQLFSLAERDELQRERLAKALLKKPIRANSINEFEMPHLSEEG